MDNATATAYNNDFSDNTVIDTTNRALVDRNMTRCLVFAGNVLLPQFTRHYEKMTMGGEHLGQDFKTLRHTKGVLRRAQLVPMVPAYDWINPDILGDKKDDFRLETPEGTKYGVPCLPGDEIEGILQNQQGAGDKGIREAEAMRGKPLSEFSRVQRVIFPKWDLYVTARETDKEQMPVTVSALENHLNERRAVIGDSLADSVIETLLESCDQYRRWGTAYLDAMARLVKAAPTPGGNVYQWSPLAVMLFEQLELNREEFLMRKSTEDRQSDAATSRELDEMRSLMNQFLPAIGKLAQMEVARSTRPDGQLIEKLEVPVDYALQTCADSNARGEACKAKVVKEIDGVFYCLNHPRAE
jgi:hypothetical protein